MSEKKSLQVITLGCSKNTVDSEHLLAQIQDDFNVVGEDFNEPVDYQLINTCGFIGDAKEQSVQTILNSVQRKKNGDIGKLIVFGCLSQRYMDQLPGLIPEVDGWYGARDIAPVVKALGGKINTDFDTRRRNTGVHGTYAYLKISEGCDRRCSFCAIPLIRGGHRSVPIEKLVKEAEGLAANGVRELVLIAQDTTYYGLDIYKKRALADLLKELSKIENIHWIRIHYSYPADFPEDVLEQMAVNPKVCRYLDIPLQHISDKVLSNMRRHVDGAWTRALITKMRERVPGIVLRTTMIVGHPGEGVREFNELMDFVKEARFERLGAFKYSEEEGTYDAEHFKDTVSATTKQNRLSKLMTLQSGISFAYNKSRIGSEIEVLIDECTDNSFVCRSEFESPEVDGEILVKFNKEQLKGETPQSMVGKFVQVRVIDADEYDLIAELI